MAIKVQIPTPMREQAGGKAEVDVSGGTVKAALDDLVRQHPAQSGRSCSTDGKLRPYINVFLNDEDIRYLDEMDTAVTDGIIRRPDSRGRGRAERWPTEPDRRRSPTRRPTGRRCSREIPAELGVHPLLLAALHAYVFLEGSRRPRCSTPPVGEEAMHYVVHLPPAARRCNDLRRAREDMAALVGFAKAEKWPKQHVRFLHDFLKENGIGR